jgi:hypothetical protein
MSKRNRGPDENGMWTGCPSPPLNIPITYVRLSFASNTSKQREEEFFWREKNRKLKNYPSVGVRFVKKSYRANCLVHVRESLTTENSFGRMTR